MNIIYDKKNDKLILINSKGTNGGRSDVINNRITVDFDESGAPVIIEIDEASILLKIPSKVLKEFVGVK